MHLRAGPLRAAAGAAIVVALATAGCGRNLAAGSASATLAPPAAGLRYCPLPDWATNWPGSRLPAGYTAIEVYDCRVEVRRLPGQGEWQFLQERRATGDLSAYLKAMRAADERSSDDVCTLDLVPDPPAIWIDASGVAVHPRAPRDDCGKPQTRVLNAYAALAFTVVGEVRLAQVTPQLELDTRCADTWKDMLALETETRPAPPGERWLASTHGAVRVCVYRTDYVKDEISAGYLDDGAVAPPAAVRALARALEQTPPPAPCADRHSRFAVVHSDAGDEVYIELDGCLRVMTDRGTWRQGDAALVATVLGLGGS